MTKYSALAIVTAYWKPNDNYCERVINALRGKVENDDFVVISEKALAVATGNIVDESKIIPNAPAKFLAIVWMRLVWGYPLGVVCGFGQRLLRRLREYPVASGSRHKQVALQRAGLMQALMFGSEGGIDGSNIAFSYVSLPLRDAAMFAQEIQKEVAQRLAKNVCILIADTDKTYKFQNFFFTPRPNPFIGIQSFAGVLSYVLGRVLKLRKSSTPLAVAGCSLAAAQALTITNIADRARGPGSGATVWDMAARFSVNINEVTWEMLATIQHKPIVIVRKRC